MFVLLNAHDVTSDLKLELASKYKQRIHYCFVDSKKLIANFFKFI